MTGEAGKGDDTAKRTNFKKFVEEFDHINWNDGYDTQVVEVTKGVFQHVKTARPNRPPHA